MKKLDKQYAHLQLNGVNEMISIYKKLPLVQTSDTEFEVAQKDLEEINILLHQTKARLTNVINRD